MSNQESMFADQEARRSVNTDPRERSSEQMGQESYERPYNDPLQRDDGKIRPQQPRRRRWVPFAVIAVIVVLALGAISGYGAYAYSTAPTTVTPHTFQMNGHSTLVMDVGSGNVHVHTGSGDAIAIKETHRSGGFVSSNDNIKYSQDGNTVTVREGDTFSVVFGFSSTSFDVTLPASSDLQVQTGSGSIEVAGMSGQVNMQTGSGDINADAISGQQATLKTGSGDITLHDISSQQDVLNTGSGSIDAQNLSGQVTLETGSGSTKIEQGALKGDSVLKAGSGDISYTGSLDPSGNYRFQTGSGDVELNLPSTSAFTLDTHTGSGSVNNDFGSSQVGNDPRAPVSINTGSGDISINRD